LRARRTRPTLTAAHGNFYAPVRNTWIRASRAKAEKYKSVRGDAVRHQRVGYSLRPLLRQ
jgi:hypothetical protein